MSEVYEIDKDSYGPPVPRETFPQASIDNEEANHDFSRAKYSIDHEEDNFEISRDSIVFSIFNHKSI